jgi:HPt (histidine-containing phosphotransfer) domain-containing protein
MTNHSASIPFKFHEKIDESYIYEMYGEDYTYIQTIFETVLDDYDSNLDLITGYYKEGNIEMLRKTIHKIKPSFGFIGMLEVQKQCQSFENLCLQPKDVEMMKTAFQKLTELLIEAKNILMNEQQKLIQYNSTT